MTDTKDKLYKLNLVKETIEDYNIYNKEYLKPCKLYYKIGNKTFKCGHCLEFHSYKFIKNF